MEKPRERVVIAVSTQITVPMVVFPSVPNPVILTRMTV